MVMSSGRSSSRWAWEKAFSRILNSHGGNRVISQYIADRINHETEGIAVELGAAAAPFRQETSREPSSEDPEFDRHGGVGETSSSLYLIPDLVELARARTATLTMPEHLEQMVPEVVAGDPTALLVFLAESLKAEKTGKGTSTREVTDTGVWSVRDLEGSDLARGRRDAEAFVDAAVGFIERWKELRPME